MFPEIASPKTLNVAKISTNKPEQSPIYADKFWFDGKTQRPVQFTISVEVQNPYLKYQFSSLIKRFFSQVNNDMRHEANKTIEALFQRADYDQFLTAFMYVDGQLKKLRPNSENASITQSNHPIPGTGLFFCQFTANIGVCENVLFNQFVINGDFNSEYDTYQKFRLYPKPSHFSINKKLPQLITIFDRSTLEFEPSALPNISLFAFSSDNACTHVCTKGVMPQLH